MTLAREVLDLLNETFYSITVDVRDARKVKELFRDDSSLIFKQNGSDVFIFKNQDDLDSALDILKRAKITPSEIEGEDN